MRKSEKGAFFLPVLLGLAVLTGFASGVITLNKAGFHTHREPLKQGKPEYKVNN